MNGYHCFNFTEKLSYEVQTLSNQKMSNFYFDLSFKLSQGEVHDFSGEVQKFSEEVQNDPPLNLHLPSKSGHELQHPICDLFKAKNQIQ
jgi:imidazoleglycerol phosphate dehydratase HisB